MGKKQQLGFSANVITLNIRGGIMKEIELLIAEHGLNKVLEAVMKLLDKMIDEAIENNNRKEANKLHAFKQTLKQQL